MFPIFAGCSSAKESPLLVLLHGDTQPGSLQDEILRTQCFLPDSFQKYQPLIHPKYYPITLFRLKEASGRKADFDPLEFKGLMQGLNAFFEPLHVQFFVSRYEELLRDSTSLNYYDNQIVPLFESVRDDPSLNPRDALGRQSINLFISDTIIGAGGVAILNLGIAIRARETANTLIHEMGHYFGLWHPHERFEGKEFVDGSNCRRAGDLLCDTPADPHLDADEKNYDSQCLVAGCEIISCPSDPNGMIYQPDTANIMGYYDNCDAYHFSSEQMKVMLCIQQEGNRWITHDQPEDILDSLISGIPGELEVGCEGDSFAFHSLFDIQDAVNKAQPGSRISICEGEYTGGIDITIREKELSLEAKPNARVDLVSGKLIIIDSKVGIHNIHFRSGNAGGLLAAKDSSLVFKNVSFTQAASTQVGGCIDLVDSELHMEGGLFFDCKTFEKGGAIYTSGGVLELNQVSFGANFAKEGGGALFLDRTLFKTQASRWFLFAGNEPNDISWQGSSGLQFHYSESIEKIPEKISCEPELSLCQSF